MELAAFEGPSPAPLSPRFVMGYPYVPLRHPPRPRLLPAGSPHASAGAPPPHPRLRQGILIRFCRQPPPHPRLRRRIPIRFCRPPPPRPRLRRSAPAPRGGQGLCVAISGEQPYPGCSRWEAASGSFPGSPRALDCGNIATGGGADGEGELVPPSLSLTLQAPYSLPALSRPAFSRQATRTLSVGPLLSHPVLSQGIPIHFCRQPPPRPRLRRSSPAPKRGRGQCLRYQGSNRARGEPVGHRARLFSRISPCAGPWGYRHWGWGRRGGGTRSPSPVSHAPNTLFPRSPTPPAPPGSSHEADRATIAMRKGGSASPAGGHL